MSRSVWSVAGRICSPLCSSGTLFRLACLTVALLASSMLPAQEAPPAASGAASPAAQGPATAVPSTAAASPAAAASEPLPALLAPPPAGFDAQARGRDILAHLNAVIRYYRSTLTPIQRIGEPTDALYREEAIANAKQVANYAFLAGKADGALLSAYQKRQGTQAATQAAPRPNSSPSEGEAEKLQAARANLIKQSTDLKAQQQALLAQLAAARPRQAQALRSQLQQIDGQLELGTVMSDTLGKIVGMSDTQGREGLNGDIERLLRTAPEITDAKSKTVPSPLESFSSASSAGLSTQAIVLVQLLNTRHAIDLALRQTDALHQQALNLRTPLTNVVRGLIEKGQQLAQPASGAPTPAAQTTEDFASVTATFKAISTVAIPLSQEVITLEQSRANLAAWRAAVNVEYQAVLRSLLLRGLVIVVALGILLSVGEVWRRLTTRYVHDLRRRRQLLGMRRLVIGFLSGLVILFGFVTQFNSLATFAGFITAGLAVGLQTILLSVAAYFFIVGRYGVRVGDRITVGGVTGDVIEVGLVRFYVMELAGSGNELQPTGRVAVLSNAILFQAATPLYKQLPGTEYAWHEMTARLEESGDYEHAAAAMLAAIKGVYESYRPRIEQQQKHVESWMDARLEAPIVDSRLQLVDGGLQLLVRFPVEIREASQIDEQVAEALLRLLHQDEGVKRAVTAPPTIKAAVKG